ncbi:hypothetical protein LSAT2_006524 [Lamellibrachia satsuma]|nr:hypothetical protein LSAT2_006524 [Lamellibrachia satsuma]
MFIAKCTPTLAYAAGRSRDSFDIGSRRTGAVGTTGVQRRAVARAGFVDKRQVFLVVRLKRRPLRAYVSRPSKVCTGVYFDDLNNEADKRIAVCQDYRYQSASPTRGVSRTCSLCVSLNVGHGFRPEVSIRVTDSGFATYRCHWFRSAVHTKYKGCALEDAFHLIGHCVITD